MSTLAIFLVLFLFCSSIYAIGETIHQRIKLQNACDAAAYSAAVIQADGLSRMASINRAMSWTYVQMTNRQMDYITFRWLKLTCQQFDEDLKNAKEYKAQLILPMDKEFTWVGMVIEGVCALAVDYILEILHLGPDCYGKLPKGLGTGHKAEGLAYWCSTAPAMPATHQIVLNNPPPEFSLNAVVSAAANAASEMLLTKDVIQNVCDILGALIGGNGSDNPEDWGSRLGLLIDYDKANIEMMNNALPMVNKLMTLSMKVSSENILKSSLKDRRMEDGDILKDYHVSIKIPCATNPYDVESVTEAVDSYFSALHNTEADEMLFLNMQSTEQADGSLPSHFPVLTGSGGLAYGLDQWFIRGRGIYENADNEEACYMAQKGASYTKPKNIQIPRTGALAYLPKERGKSGWVNGTDEGSVRLKGTERSDGGNAKRVGVTALGIQRVYKDANLNETSVGGGGVNTVKHEGKGAIYCVCTPGGSSPKKMETGVYLIQDIQSGGSRVWPKVRCSYDDGKRNKAKEMTKQWCKENLPECCSKDENLTVWVSDEGGKSAKTAVISYKIKPHDAVMKKTEHTVSRGNHIVNFMTALAEMKGAVSAFSGNEEGDDNGSFDDGGDDKDTVDVGDSLDLAKGELADRKSLKDQEIDDLEKKIQNGDDSQETRDALAKARQERASYDSDEQSLNNEGSANMPFNNNQGGTASQSGSASSSASALVDFATNVLGLFLGDFLDVQPSVANDPSLPYTMFPMCQSASKTYALYSQYRWASGKWYCLTNLKSYALCMFLNGRKIWCDTSERKLTKKIFGIKIKYKVKGKGHWHVPKWFCGTKPRNPLDQVSYAGMLNISMPTFVDTLANYFPPAPLFGIYEGLIDGSCHGYLTGEGDWENFVMPIMEQLFDKDTYIERDEYENCVPFIGMAFAWSPLGSAAAGLFQGHSRIYGDDKRIFDNRYVGAKCKPWVLNERFFTERGTIVVGAAMKHRNPFVQLFDFLNRQYTEDQNLPEGSLLSAFNIPKGNVMWTMSASRAGVCRHRRNGLFDQERQYQITYDPTSDVENLAYVSGKGPFYFHPNSDNGNKGSWKSIERNSTPAWTVDEPNNEQALSRPDVEGQKTVAVWGGCPCNGNNAEAFRFMWNLCEWDWDATLIPLRYAGVRARLRMVKENGRPMSFANKSLDELPYNDRLQAIEEMREMSDKSHDLKSDTLQAWANNDDYLGDGRHWEWDMDNKMGINDCWKRDPFLISAWKRADATFFEEAAAAAVQGAANAGGAALNNSYQDIDLKTKLPEEKDNDSNAEIRYWNLLRSNRIL